MRYIYLFMCMLTVSIYAQDIVHLKNGKMIKGQVSEENGQVIIVQKKGKIIIHKSKVKSIEKNVTQANNVSQQESPPSQAFVYAGQIFAFLVVVLVYALFVYWAAKLLQSQSRLLFLRACIASAIILLVVLGSNQIISSGTATQNIIFVFASLVLPILTINFLYDTSLTKSGMLYIASVGLMSFVGYLIYLAINFYDNQIFQTILQKMGG